MRARLAILVLCCCVSCTPTARQEEALWLDSGKHCLEAEAAFDRGLENRSHLLVARKHFSEATDVYLKVKPLVIRTPQLYRNLGNAAVLADRWPVAIWAYQTGLKLDPNDSRMRDQLAFVRGKVLYSAKGQGRPEPDLWPGWLHRPTRVELLGLLFFLYVWQWIAISYWLVKRSTKSVLFLVAVTVVALLVCVGLRYEWHQLKVDRDTPLVVLVENSDFYRGNAASYPKHADLPFLPRGLEARQLHRRGDWLQIRLTTGEVGWVPAGNVLVVEPPIE
jgi:hypothetical protein